MIAVAGIYLAVLAIYTLAGLAVQALLTPRGRWLRLWTMPLGAGAFVLLLQALSLVAPVRVAAPIAMGLVLAVLIGALARRIVGSERTGVARVTDAMGALTPRRADVLIALAGVAVGLVYLAPILATGFPTVLQTFSEDAWYYIGTTEWLVDHTSRDLHATDPGATFPLHGFSVGSLERGSLPMGFELTAAAMKVLLLRDATFEVIGITAASGGALAAIGWAHLHRVLSSRPSLVITIVTACAAGVSPLVALAYSQSNLANAFGLGLLPIAIALTVCFFRSPRFGTLIPAAISCGAVIASYNSLLPWLALIVLAVAACVHGTPSGRLRALWPAPRRGRVVAALAGLGLLVALALIVAPIAALRAVRFAKIASGFSSDDVSPVPISAIDTYAGLVTGALGAIGAPVTTGVTAGLVLVAVAACILLVRALATPGERLIAVLLVAGLAATGITFLQYRIGGFGYGAYKSVITGGAICGGLLLVGLAVRNASPRWNAVSLAAAAACTAIWVPVAASTLDTLHETPIGGLRRAHAELLQQLAALPPGSNVLLEGTDAARLGGSAATLQMRMVAAYGDILYPDITIQGLKSTEVPIDPLGQVTPPEYRPSQPWTHVVESRPSPFGAGRELLWRSQLFSLYAAPEVDVTEYGPHWYPPEGDERGSYQWLGGPGEFVVGNRSSSPRDVTLSFIAESWEVPRTATVQAPGFAPLVFTVPAGGDAEIRYPVRVPAGEVLTITVATDPGPVAGLPTGLNPDRAISLRIRNVHLVPGTR